MKRELARQEDRPPFIIIGLNEDEISQIEYEQDEITRLNKEKEELIRQYEAKIAELTRRLSQTEPLKIFRDYLSLDCPHDLSRKKTIIECANFRESRRCREKNCSARNKLLSYLHHFFKKLTP